MYRPSDGVFVRLLRPGFEYPANIFKHQDGLYYPSEEIVFLVSKGQSLDSSDDVFTEVAIWHPDEIRLLGAISLSVPESGGFVVFAPWHGTFLSQLTLDSDLSLDTAVETCLNAAIQLQNDNESLEGNRYTLRDFNSDSKVLTDLFDNIEPEEGLLIRGLYTLLKSSLLMQQHVLGDFMEEAFMNMQISREAALELIREHLHYLGNPNPSFKQAHEYLRSNFQIGDGLVEYLEEQHDKWIETKHPLSVFGAEWAPSIQAEDIYETHGILVSIYRHIILGEPGGSSAL